MRIVKWIHTLAGYGECNKTLDEVLNWGKISGV